MKLETIIRVAATGLGLIVIVVPLAVYYRQRIRQRHAELQRPNPVSLRVPVIFTLTIFYLLVGIWLWIPILDDLSGKWRIALTIAGAVFYFPGIGLYLWGLITLGRQFSISNTRTAMLYSDHELVQSGPYRYVRHPMYAGVILTAMGAGLVFRTWAMILFGVTALSVILRARREEELLQDRFGSSWVDYRERVPGWLPSRKHMPREIVGSDGDDLPPS